MCLRVLQDRAQYGLVISLHLVLTVLGSVLDKKMLVWYMECHDTSGAGVSSDSHRLAVDLVCNSQSAILAVSLVNAPANVQYCLQSSFETRFP